jgi:hypothetical protein
VKHLACILVALLLVASCAKGRSGFALCDAMISDRGAFGMVVHLYGDSISRGIALGKYESGSDPLNPTDPLYAFRSIESTANWALELNARSERFVYCGNIKPEVIKARIRSGIIRAGDTIILEDAGDYVDGPDSYYQFWLDARRAASEDGVALVMMTMFDYCENDNQACAMQFDAPVGGQGTLNDAIRRAANVSANPVRPDGHTQSGNLHFIDMNWVMDAWRRSALSIDGVDVMRRDGVHPNVWGQMKMTQHYLVAAGLSPYVTEVGPLEELAEQNAAVLAYGAPTFTGSRARTYVASMLDGD